MKTAEQWLQEYAESHQHPFNQRLHSLCVPLIFWSVLTLVWTLPQPYWLEESPLDNWGVVLALALLVFYFGLGWRHGLEMLVASGVALLIDAGLEHVGFPLRLAAVLIFAGAWAGQFYGHKIEGRQPSFLTDVLFLLIGPLWVIREISTAPNGLFRSQTRS